MGGPPKIWEKLQIIHFYRVSMGFHYKPSIFGGPPLYLETSIWGLDGGGFHGDFPTWQVENFGKCSPKQPCV